MLSKFFFDSLVLSSDYIYTSPFYIFLIILEIFSTMPMIFLIPRVIKDIEKRYNVDIASTSSRTSEFDFCRFISQSYFKKKYLDLRTFNLYATLKLFDLKKPKKPFFYSYTKYKKYNLEMKKYFKDYFEYSDKHKEDRKNFQFKYDIKSENKFNIIVYLNFYVGILLFGLIIILPYIIAVIINLLKLLLF